MKMIKLNFFLLLFALLFILACKNNVVISNSSIDIIMAGNVDKAIHPIGNDSVEIIIIDSLVNGRYTLKVSNRFICNKDVSIDYKRNCLIYNDSMLLNDRPIFDFVTFNLVHQRVDFMEFNKTSLSIRNTIIFDSIRKKNSAFEGFYSVIDRVYLVKGRINDLYLISEEGYSDASVWAFYTMNGELLWYELINKSYHFNYGEYQSILKKYGIDEIFEDHYLRNCTCLYPLYGFIDK